MFNFMLIIAIFSSMTLVVNAATTGSGSVSINGNFSDTITHNFSQSVDASLNASYGQYSSNKVAATTTYCVENSTDKTKFACITWDGDMSYNQGGENDIVLQYTKIKNPYGTQTIQYQGHTGAMANNSLYSMTYTLTVY